MISTFFYFISRLYLPHFVKLILIFFGEIFYNIFTLSRSKQVLKKKLKFKNKIAVVTGGNKGIGKEITLILAKGYDIYILARDEITSLNVIKELSKIRSGNHRFIKVDLLDLNRVTEIANSLPYIDILVNNAGISTGPAYEVNHVAHFLLSSLVRNKVKNIVFVSSSVAYTVNNLIKAKFDFYYNYSLSKLCNLLIAKYFNDKIGIKCSAVHPGIINSGLFTNHVIINVLMSILRLGVNSEKDGAINVVNAIFDRKKKFSFFIKGEDGKIPCCVTLEMAEELYRSTEKHLKSLGIEFLPNVK